jgi:hypothetical protein
VADFPDVPDVPGVPAVPRDPNAAVADIVLLTSDAVGIFGAQGGQQWGLFQNGEPVVVSDNVLAFGYSQAYDVSNYQVEDGAFQTYNKTQEPADVRLQFSTGGSTQDKQNFIASIAAIIGSTELFDGVTPEQTYPNLNPVRQIYDRTAVSGAGLLKIDVHCVEVMVNGQVQFTNSQGASSSSQTDGTAATPAPISDVTGQPLINDPQSPSASPQVADGNVQPTTPTSTQSAITRVYITGGTVVN